MEISVDEVLALAVEYLDLKENLLSNDKRAKLLFCLNAVSCQLATGIAPLKMTKKMMATAEGILYSSFERQPIDIFSVKVGGCAVGFKMFPTKLVTTQFGEAEICFSYLPKKVAQGQSIEAFAKVTAHMLALGACSEYALVCGMYDKASIFEQRYKELLRSVLMPQGERKIKAERWY